MVTLGTAMVLKNVTRWKVERYAPHLDDDVPWVQLDICFLHPDGSVYECRHLAIASNGQCDILAKKTTPLTTTDLIQGNTVNVPAAYAAIVAAHDGTVGTRFQKRTAIEPVLVTHGICFA